MYKMELNKVIKYPLATEKSVRLMEAENKLIFIVDKKSKKQEIKEAAESLFSIKVDNVNTTILITGKKKAYLTLSKDTPAIDVATQLGLI